MISPIRKFSACMLIALASCGAEEDVATPSQIRDESTTDHSKDVTFDIHRNWRINDKRCMGKPIDVEPAEAYRFDQSTFVQIRKAVDDDTRTCVAGDFYLVVMNSMESSNKAFEQTGWLRPMGRKVTCRAIENGVKAQDVTSSQEDVPASDKTMDLTMRVNLDSSDVHLLLRNHPDCASGILELTLGS